MADAADPMHAASRGSRDAWLRSGGNLISTDYVIDETLTLIRMRLGLRVSQGRVRFATGTISAWPRWDPKSAYALTAIASGPEIAKSCPWSGKSLLE